MQLKLPSIQTQLATVSLACVVLAQIVRSLNVSSFPFDVIDSTLQLPTEWLELPFSKLFLHI